MNRKWMMVAGLTGLALTIALAACGPKKPPMTDEPMVRETPPPAEEVMEEPPMMMHEDPKPWMSDDLMEVNRWAVAEGGMVADVYFDFDKYDLRPDAREGLARNAEFLRQHPEFVVSLEGHCDERGTNAYNLALGDRRASAAKGYLASLGVTGDRMGTISYGEERPVCTQSDESCWQRNRRAHFVITGRTNAG